MSTSSLDFFTKHEFLIRRLHSLTGLIPVGAFMTVHLLVNASVLGGAAAFQGNVNNIHALGPLLPLVEWLFIFIPIIFHALVGVWIIKTGKPNTSHYRYVNNWRYTLQRITGMIAIVFIFLHVLHMHGWIHTEWWLSKIEPWGMAQFRPYNAASTLSIALTGIFWPPFYFIGILASVFHLANGIWTMGITWGVWTSPRAQRDATYLCTAGGVVLLIVGLSGLFGGMTLDQEEAKKIEDSILKARLDSRQIEPAPHKTTDGHKAAHGQATEAGENASSMEASGEETSSNSVVPTSTSAERAPVAHD